MAEGAVGSGDNFGFFAGGRDGDGERCMGSVGSRRRRRRRRQETCSEILLMESTRRILGFFEFSVAPPLLTASIDSMSQQTHVSHPLSLSALSLEHVGTKVRLCGRRESFFAPAPFPFVNDISAGCSRTIRTRIFFCCHIECTRFWLTFLFVSIQRSRCRFCGTQGRA